MSSKKVYQAVQDDEPLLPIEFETNKTTYGAVKPYGNQGGKSIFMAHNKKAICIQTPRMFCPFGLSQWDKKEKDKDGNESASFKFEMNLSLEKITPDLMEASSLSDYPNLSIWSRKLSELDEKLLSDGIENSMNWIGKKITSKEVISELYTPCVKYSRDKNTDEIIDKYPPNFKVTLPYSKGKFECKVYNKEGMEVDPLTVNMQKAYITAIIECKGIWVVGKKYGTTWRVLQMMVEPKTQMAAFAFRQVANDIPAKKGAHSDEEPEEDTTHGVEAGSSEEIVEDSDDELEAGKKGKK